MKRRAAQEAQPTVQELLSRRIPDVVAEQLAAMLWPTVERVVNAPEPAAWHSESYCGPCRLSPPCARCVVLWRESRAFAEALVSRATLPNRTAMAPLVLQLREGRLGWVPLVGAMDDCHAPGPLVHAGLALLAHPAIRSRLRRCQSCRRFRLARVVRAAVRRKDPTRRHFCSEGCRRAWLKAADGRAWNARRKRAYVDPPRRAIRSATR